MTAPALKSKTAPLSPLLDPRAPFPEMGAAGEFGRAWVDSLYHQNPTQYRHLEQSGRLHPLIREKERAAQSTLRAILESPNAPRRPAGSLTPDQWETQRYLQARETVMAQLREEWTTPELDLSEEETPTP